MNAGPRLLALCLLAVLSAGCGPALHGVITLIGGTSEGIRRAGITSSDVVDQAPEIAVNEKLVVREGSAGNLIGRDTLLVTDDGPTITFRLISPPTNGMLLLEGTVLVADDTFTQEDINDDRVTYDHDDSETLIDVFEFEAADSGGNTVKGVFQITITPVNDPPALSNDGLTLNEGAMAVIGNSVLLASDKESPANALVYTIQTLPAFGTLQRAGMALGPGAMTFTQEDVNAGAITYMHDGSETTSDSFVFTLSDATIGPPPDNLLTITQTLAPDTFTLMINPVNDAPVLSAPSSLTLSEDVSASVSGLSLSDADAGADDVALRLVLSGMAGMTLSGNLTVATDVSGGVTPGQVARNGTADVAITAPLAALNTTLAAAGGLTLEGGADQNGTVMLTVTANDRGNNGNGGIGTDTRVIPVTINAVNDAPVINAASSPSVDEDGTVALTGLSVTDVDAGAAAIRLTLSVPQSTGMLTIADNVTGGVNDTQIANNSTRSVTLTAPLASLNATLGDSSGVLFRPTTNFNGTVALTVSADDLENSGAGGSMVTDATVTITVNPINDAPSLILPGPPTTAEDTGVAITGIIVGDVDAGAAPLTCTFTVTNGRITIDERVAGGVDSTQVTSNGGTKVSITAPLAALNTTLAAPGGVVYQPDGNGIGVDTLMVGVVDDKGASLEPQGSLSINVTAVNDAPVNSAPATLSTDEDTPLDVTGLAVSDVDIGGSNIQVSLTATLGVLALRTNVSGGVTAAMVTGNGSSAVTVTAPPATLNTTLAASGGLIFSPNNDVNGAASLTISSNDLGATGAGGAQGDIDTIAITIRAVNDAPSVGTGAPPTTAEDTAVNITGLSVTDRDAGGANVTAQLTVDSGALAIDTTVAGGVPAGGVTGDGTAAVTLTGTLTELAATFDATGGVRFIPAADFSGPVTLTLSADDQGNAGSGGVQTASTTLTITVTAVNDGPTLTLPAALTTSEDVNLALDGISVMDVDSGAADIQVGFSVSAGTLAMSASVNSGVIASQISGLGTATLTVNAPVAAIAATLAAPGGLTYQPNLNINGSDSLQVNVNDLGGSGAGTALTISGAVPLTITAVNDAPVLSAPALLTTLEDSERIVSSVSVTDVDSGSAAVRLTLAVTSGAITVDPGIVGGVGPGAITGSGTGTVQLEADLAELNATLAGDGVRVQPALDQNGDVALSLLVDDLGNTGSGGNLTDMRTITLRINAVNDAPINALPAPPATDEDTALAISGLSISDVDAALGTLTVTLSVTSGTLELNTGVTGGVSSATANMTSAVMITGTIAALNATLADPAGLTYRPNTDFNGADTLTVRTDDNGNSGSGGALVDTDTLTITVNPINDAPTFTLPGPLSTDENTDVFVTGLRIADVDSEGSDLLLTLSVAGGTGTLMLNTGVAGGVSAGQVIGNGTSDLTLTASRAALNLTLADSTGLRYRPPSGFNGPVTINLAADDQGATGSGGPLQAGGAIPITVGAVNDPPVNTVPGALTLAEDADIVVSGLSVADPDAGSAAVVMTLSVSSGRLELDAGVAATLGAGELSGNGSRTLQLMSSTAVINSTLGAMNALRYRPDADFNGADLLTVTTNDQGNTGSGGAATDIDTVAITVTAVNDPPVNTAPPSFATDEDVALALPGLSIADVDAGSANIQVSLVSTTGTLTLDTAVTAGVTAGQVVGNGSAGLTITAPRAAINNTLASSNGLTLQPASNFNGSATITLTTNDLGNTGAGGEQTDSDTISISVNAVNDGPILTAPATATTNEDTDLLPTGLNVTDIDSGTSPVRLTLSVTGGLLILRTDVASGVTAPEVSGNSSAAVIVDAPVAAISATLAASGLTFRPDPDSNGSVSLSLTLEDLGNTGSGGALTDSATVAISVNAVNDAPVNTVPGPLATGENTPLAVTGLAIADVDAGAAAVRVTLSVSSGTLDLRTDVAGGLTAGQVSGDTTATLVLEAPLSALNTTLSATGGLVYTPNLNFNGSDTLSVTTRDLGNSGAGGELTDTDTVLIVVNDVNNAPVNTVPASITKDEDQILAIAGLLVSDVDAGAAAVDVQLSVGMGSTLTLSTAVSGGVMASEVTGNGTAALSIRAPISRINLTLSDSGGLIYRSAQDFNGADVLTMTTDDLGNSGTGGPLTDTDMVPITINPINDAPINTVPATVTTTEDTNLTLSGLAVSDVDAEGANVRLTLATPGATLAVDGTVTGGVNAAQISGNNTGTVVLTATVAAINSTLAAMDGLVYQPNTDANGVDTVTVTLSDLGNTGAGGTLTDTDSITVTVNAVNDAPVNTLSGNRSLAEDSSLVLTGLAVSDVDAGSAAIQVSLTVGASARLSLASTVSGGVTAGQISGNGSSAVTVIAPTAAINATLADASGLIYTPDQNFNGADTLTMKSDDLGNTGAGGSLTDEDQVTVTVTAVNDAPVNTLPGAVAGLEDSDTAVTGLAVADVDAAGDTIQLTLAAGNGALTVSTAVAGGVTAGAVTGNGGASVIIMASLSAINATLADGSGVVYRPSLDFNGTDTITVTTDDLGNNGAGGALSDSDPLTVSISPVNDPPVNTVSADRSTSEDTDIVLTGLSVADVDIGGNALTLTLTSGPNAILIVDTTVSGGVNAGQVTGNSTATVTIVAPLSVLNTTLADAAGLTYRPDTNFNGDSPITLLSNDGGFTGSGGALTDTDSFTVTVASSINDPPVNAVPGPLTTAEDTAVFVTGVSVSDADAGGSAISVTFSAGAGTLSVNTTVSGGVGAGQVTGNGGASVTLNAPLAAINATLANVAGLSYTPSTDVNGPDTITMTTDDLGNSGPGGAMTDTDTIAVTVTAVNDAPRLMAPGGLGTREDTDLTLSGINVSDVDAGAADDLVLTATVMGPGTLVASGAVMSGVSAGQIGGNNTATLTLTAPAAALNATLADPTGLLFRPAADFSGMVMIQLSLDDQGASGAGGSLTTGTSFPVLVTPVNDGPINTVPGARVVDEDTALDISGISITDIDAGSDAIEVTLAVTAGTLTVDTGVSGGVGASALTGNATGSVVITAPLSAINTTLAAAGGLRYQGNADANGTDTLTVTTSDLGRSGDGGALKDIDSVPITVNAINDAPVLTVPGALATNENVDLAVTGLRVADVDADVASLRVTLSVSNGTVQINTGIPGGLGAAAVSGNGTASVVILAPLTAINATFSDSTGVVYRPALNVSGSETLTVFAEDLGSSGAGGALTATETIAITVSDQNLAPVNTVPASLTTDEDTPVNVGGISIADPDAGAATIRVVVSVQSGATLSVDTTVAGGVAAGEVSANGSTSVTLDASLSAINTTLAAAGGLRFVPDLDVNGANQLTVTTNDLGNTGAGGALIDTDVVPVTVNAINDAPVLTLPGAQSTDEDMTLALSGLSVADVDLGTESLTLALTVSFGTLQVNTGVAGGVAAGMVSGNGTAAVSITAPSAAINATLADAAGLTFAPGADRSGSATLSVSADDRGFVGQGGARITTGAVAITVHPVNDAPVLTLPGALSTDEDKALAITGLTITDVDAGAASVRLTLGVSSNATLTASTTVSGGIAAGQVTGNGTASVVIDAPLDAIAKTLADSAGLTFAPVADANGADSLSVTISDLGNTGAGGTLTDSGAVAVTVNAVNDGPINTLPASPTTAEDTALALTGLSITDVDSGSADLTVTLAVGNGTLTASTAVSGGVSAGQISNNGTATIVLTAPRATINATLADAAGLVYTPASNFNGAETLTMTSDDGGNTGAGGALTDTDTLAITVTAVNDAPVLTSPASLTTNEDTSVVVSGVSVADVDAGSGELQLVLSVSGATLTLSTAVTGGVVSGDVIGNGSATVTVTATLSELNATLADAAGLTLAPEADRNGTETLNVTLNDLGNAGAGGPLSDSGTVTVTLNAVNDAPVVTAATNATTLEDTAVAITGITITDVDAATLAVTLATGSGTVTVSTAVAGGVTAGDVTNNGTASVSVTATPAALAATLADAAGVTVQPAADDVTAITLTVSADDQGSAGSGGAMSDSATATVTVTAVNDAPTLDAIGDVTVDEDSGDGTVSLTGIGSGGGADESGQTVTLTAVSSDPSIIPTPSVTVTGATRTLNFTPAADAFGAVTITVTAMDDGGTTNGGLDSRTRSFTLTVTSINDAPTLDAVGDVTVNEDSGAGTVTLTGLGNGAGNESGQTLTVTASSDTVAVIPTPTISGSGTARTLSFTPVADANGSATITVTVMDDGGTASGGADTVTRTFTITVNAVNDAPTLDAIGDVTVNEDSGAGTVSLTGIGSGGGTDESAQTVTLTAVSSDPAIIPTPSVTGTGATRTLNFTPAADAFGAVTITVTAMDDGGTANGGVDSRTRSFTLTVTSINDAPTLDAVANVTVNEDSGAGTVTLTGITAGASNESGQTLTVTASSDTAGVIPNPTISGSGSARTLSFTPVADANGSATITVMVMDDGGTAGGGVDTVTQTFMITVNAVNDAPTLDAIGDVTVNEDSGAGTVSLTGIGSGGGADESSQTVTLTAVSGDSSIIPTPSVTGTGATRTLNFTPAADAFGAVTITVTAMDDGGTTNGGVDRRTRSFTLTVTSINDAPTLDAVANVTVNEDSGAGTVTLTGIAAGASNESGQTLTVTASSDTTGVIPNPTVSGSGTARTLSFTPVADANGSATITVTVMDDGGTASGGVDTVTQTFTITVNAVNDAPTLDAIGAVTVNEDSGAGTVSLTGIGTGGGADESGQTVTLTAVSSDSSILPTPSVTGTGATRTLNFTPAANAFGAVTISVTAADDGGTANGGVDRVVQTFALTVTAVNDAPTLDAIADVTVNEDAGATVVTLTGISTGPSNESGQTLTSFTASSSNTAVVPSPVLTGTGATRTLTFTPAANASGTATITVSAQDDGGVANGGADSVTQTFTITVTAINDAPVNTVPATLSLAEDATRAVTGISIADVDVGADDLLVTLSVTSGTLTVSTAVTGGVAAGQVTNNGTAAVTVTASLTELNNTFSDATGLQYAGATDFNGTDTLLVLTDDQGSTGAGGSLTDMDAVAITVTAVNDPPVNTVPGAQTINEDTALTISGLAVADVDAGAGSLQVTLAVSSGVLTILDSVSGGLTAGDITNNGTASVVLTGSLTRLNATLSDSAGVMFQPAADASGAVTLTMTTNDQGLTGGAAESDTDTVTITVTAVNDAPVVTVPGAQSVNENAMLVIAGVAVADVDVAGDDLILTLTATNGTLTLDAPVAGGLTPGVISNNGSSSVTATGTLTELNTTLASATGLTYQGNLNFTGSDTITVSVSDQGSTGAGGAMTGSATIAVTVNAVNSAPVITVPAGLAASEDEALFITDVSVSDADSGANDIVVTLSVGAGVLTVSGDITDGVTALQITNNNSASVVLTATESAIRRTLTDSAGFSFTGAANANGTETLTISADDQGNTGAGGAMTAMDTVTITIAAVNDAPVNTVPATLTAAEDTSTALAGFSIADGDAAAGTITTTLSVTSGTLTVSTVVAGGIGAGEVTGDGTASVTLTSTLSAINATLADANGLTYLGATDFNGTDTLTMTTSDQGNTGAGGTLTDTDTVTITVSAANDAPTVTVPATVSTDIDQARVVSGISVADVDAGATAVSLTATVTSGTLTLDDTVTGGLAAGDITNNGTATVTASGTLAAINATLAGASGLTFTPAAGVTGAATLTVTLDDGGATGAGGSMSDSATVTINIAELLGGREGIVRIDRDTGAGARLFDATGLLGVSDVRGLAYDGTTLYAFDAATDRLVSLDTTTGAASSVGLVDAPDVVGLAAFGGALYGVDTGGRLLTIDAATGEVTTAVTISGLSASFSLSGLAATPTRLYTIDNANDQLVRLTTAGVGTAIALTNLSGSELAGLAFDSGALVSYDVTDSRLATISLGGAVTFPAAASSLPGTRRALAPAVNFGETFSVAVAARRLDTVTTSTGALAANLGFQGFGSVRGLADIGGTLYGYSEDAARIVTVSATTGLGTALATDLSGSLSTGTTITGLADDGATLYAINDMDELFTINTTTGAATLVQAISFGALTSSGLKGLAYDGTDLFAIDSTNTMLVQVSTAGVALTETALTGLGGGEVFDSLGYDGTDFLAVDTTADALVSITSAGAVSAVGTAGTGFTGLRGLAVSGAAIYGVDTATDRLVQLDATTGRGITIGGILDHAGLAMDITSGTLYGTFGTGLFTVDTTTGTSAFIGSTGGRTFRALAWESSMDRLFAVDTTGQAAILSQADGSVTDLAGATGRTIEGLAHDPGAGVLYGVDIAASPPELVTIDKTSGAATLIGSITGATDVRSLAFDRRSGELFGVDRASGALLQINTATGAPTTLGSRRTDVRSLTIRN